MSIGVFRCPACGDVDPDGNPVEIALPPSSVGPPTPFAAPPPPDVVPSVATSAEPPRILLIACGIDVVASLIDAGASGQWCPLVLELAFLMPLVSGRPWARTLALVGAVLGLLAYTARLVFGWGHFGVGEFSGVALSLLVHAFWIFALQRSDTLRYFERRGAATKRS